MSRKALLTLLAFALVACALTSAVTIVGAATLPFTVKTDVVTYATPTLAPSISDQMDEIQKQVASYRGLELKEPLQRALMTSAELKTKVETDFFGGYTQELANSDVEVLSAMGLLAPDFNLLTFYKDLYAEQIAGYYDNVTKEMYVISDSSFGGMERMTYAHEFTHVLQDQNYDFAKGLNYNDANCAANSEYCAAVQALIEGDATLSEYTWFQKFGTEKDRQQIIDFQNSYASPVYDSAPAYMKLDFVFAYDQGYNFVNALYSKGQWEAVDAAYANPPVSTEQIIHPEKYPDDVPVKVSLPDLQSALGKNWQEVEQNTMGEWYTYLILGSGYDPTFQLNDDEAKTASAGWGGDSYGYYKDVATSQFVFIWVSQWDTQKDLEEFTSASLDYSTARWGTPTQGNNGAYVWQSTTNGTIYMRQAGNRVIWLMTPNSTVQGAVIDAMYGTK
jgi:hypothetical protein